MIHGMRAVLAVVVSALSLALPGRAGPADYYLAPGGSDSNAGTQALPWRTVQHLRVDGESAEAYRVGENPGGEFRERVGFVRIGGRWFRTLPESL